MEKKVADPQAQEAESEEVILLLHTEIENPDRIIEDLLRHLNGGGSGDDDDGSDDDDADGGDDDGEPDGDMNMEPKDPEILIPEEDPEENPEEDPGMEIYDDEEMPESAPVSPSAPTPNLYMQVMRNYDESP
jgi:hypothetical protein